ncbi:flagellar biosynthesis protein FlgD [Dechloromonas denitrificans]|uniref:Basal-body rod modification protein FlgD n=1 Tax=Dechloromonas denitrificans TaxID=281362 RepID=A0A133XHR4_9RHOO|nr:flagellar hook assembly protein FlgD [Dechloromonas denitrificans]KXB30489.1 flagellar biosynthesis protein FlgD [Dechloromonas denitrificans]
MSTVSSTSSNADVIAALNGTNSKSSTNKAQDLQNSFLTMLTTQLQNQDPLNPMDNAQMTSQLAQISTLEGIQGLNTTLTKLLSSYNTSQALQAAGAIGSQVLTEGSNLVLSKGVTQGGVSLGSAADKVTVTIKNAAGAVVQTQDLGKQSAGIVAFAWDGKNASGTQLADGKYTFTIEASKAGTKVTATPIQVGTVSAVVKNGSSFELELSSGETVAFDEVLQFM